MTTSLNMLHPANANMPKYAAYNTNHCGISEKLRPSLYKFAHESSVYSVLEAVLIVSKHIIMAIALDCATTQ